MKSSGSDVVMCVFFFFFFLVCFDVLRSNPFCFLCVAKAVEYIREGRVL